MTMIWLNLGKPKEIGTHALKSPSNLSFGERLNNEPLLWAGKFDRPGGPAGTGREHCRAFPRSLIGESS